MNKQKTISCKCLAASLMLVLSLPLQATDLSADDSKFDIWVGWFRADQDSTIRVDSSSFDLGTELNLEDDFGLDKTLNKVFRGGVSWQFAPRHAFSVEYYQFRRNSSSSAARDFKWDDIEVSLGTQVDLQLDIDIFETHYDYSFIKTPKHTLRGSFGLFWTRIDAELDAFGSAQVGVNGEPVSGEASANGTAAGLAPMPVFGLIYDWRFARNWSIGASFDWFDISVDDVSGSLLNWDAGISYQTPWAIYVALNYTSYDFDLTLDTSDWQGEFSWKFSGPQLFLGARF